VTRTVLAIDPGPDQSAFVVWDGRRVLDHAIGANEELFRRVFGVAEGQHIESCAIEMIACYGMAVGEEVFRTCVWIGRFFEQWLDLTRSAAPALIPRLDVKMHLCHTPQAKDPNIRQALIDRFGRPGTKKAPGPLYGITSHCWAALAVAITAHDRMSRPENPAPF
jgi:hypothetical protein